MNYRHAYHAGNFADVLKHVVLMMLIDHLKKKPAPFFFLDTHAGRGLYDLSEAQSQRSGEYKNGIGRLLDAPRGTLPDEATAYVQLVRASAGPEHSAITAYPGSPLIVARMRPPTVWCWSRSMRRKQMLCAQEPDAAVSSPCSRRMGTPR
jgi:23S rRNA (adenine2030-N6)-methyltransferase